MGGSAGRWNCNGVWVRYGGGVWRGRRSGFYDGWLAFIGLMMSQSLRNGEWYLTRAPRFVRLLPLSLTAFATVAILLHPSTGFACSCADEPAFYFDAFKIPAEQRYYYYINGRLEFPINRDPDRRLADAVRVVAEGKNSDRVVIPNAAWFLEPAGTASLAPYSGWSDPTIPLRNLEERYRDVNDQAAATLSSMRLLVRSDGEMR